MSNLPIPAHIGDWIMSKDFRCGSCNEITTQFSTDDGEYYFPMCGECN